MTALAPEVILSELSEDQILAAYQAGSLTLEDAMGELRGRDQREQDRRDALRARRSDPVTAEWADAAHGQYTAAEAACAGKLVRKGSAVTDAWQLWSGPEWLARQSATEELRNYWDDHPRIPTVTEWRRQNAAGHRIQADERDAEAAQEVPPIQGETMTEQAAEAVPATDRTPSALTYEERLRAARENARAAVAERAAQYRAASERPASQAQVAVQAPAALVRQREAVDGAKTLGYLFTFLKRFAVWGSDAEIVTAALWIAQTYARDGDGMPIWQYCARLGIFGPSGSGKSWKSRLIGKLSHKGEILVEPTKPAFIDLCAEQHTVILTEADEAFRSPGRSRGIVAVINASYEPDRSSSRKQGGVAVKIPLFVHAVLDGIDDVMLSENRPDLRALVSRCIVMLSRKAPEGYRPPRFDRQARMVAEMIGQRCAQWMAQEVADGMADDVPEVPEHLGNRPFALWEPLMTVALRADQGDPEGPWSVAARDACEQLEAAFGTVEQDEDTKSELDRIMSEWED